MPKYSYRSDIGIEIEQYFSYEEALPYSIKQEGVEYTVVPYAPSVIYKGDGWTKGSYANADSVDRFKWDEIDAY